jgi:hypothetical protein
MEIGFKDKDIGEYITYINDLINELTHTNEDTYMMLLLADIIRLCINLRILTYDELFSITEHEVLDIIENNLEKDSELKNKWYLFKNINEFPLIEQPPIRDKVINPLVVNKRLKP